MDEISMTYAGELKRAIIADDVNHLIIYDDDGNKVEYFRKPQSGRWIERYDDEGFKLIEMRCSECGDLGVIHFKYCPHCGSLMENYQF